MDSYRSLLNQFDTGLTIWLVVNYTYFIAIDFKKIKKKFKPLILPIFQKNITEIKL